MYCLGLRDKSGSNTAAVAVLASLAAAGAAYGVWRLTSARLTNKRMPENTDPHQAAAEDGTINVELHVMEQVMVRHAMVAPVTTLTWLHGDIEKATAVISQRVKDIVKNNPWIAGKFVRLRNDKVAISYQKEPEMNRDDCVRNFLKIVRPSDEAFFTLGLGLRTPVKDFCQICIQHKLMLEFPNEFHQPFWRVAIIPDKDEPGKRYAVVMALSHIVGDGHTYYKIYNMLMGGEPVHQLTAERIQTFQEEAKQAMGAAEGGFGKNIGFGLSMLRGFILSKFVGPLLGTKRYKLMTRYLLVDSNKIEKLKEEFKATTKEEEGVPLFVSTNDIISSWFFRNCTSAQHAIMTINFRGRLPGYTDSHTGNYEKVLYYRNPKDTNKPSLIRQSLSSFRRVLTSDQPISAREMMFQDFCLCTNWSTFISHSVDLAGCKPLVHVPAYDADSVLPANLTVCIIFEARPKQLALLLSGTEENLKALSSAPFESNNELI